LSYEVDLWGRVRRSVAAARQQAQASAADLQTARLSLHSEVAIDYFEVRSADAQERLLNDTVKAYTEALRLTQNRFEGGAAPKSDVAQAKTQLEDAKVLASDITVQRAQYEHALAILIGKPPAAFHLAVSPLNLVAPVLPAVPVTLPAQLLERRPDIAAAERRMASANAQIGVAKAEFFPQISLTGSGGGGFGRSSAFSSLMSSHTGIWSYGAQVSQPIFTGGALRGNLHLAESQHQQALLAYKQSIQRAFGDVSDALIAYQKFHEVRIQQEQLVADLDESVRLSIMRYQGGTTTYLEVLDGQRSLFAAELTLAQARGNEYQSLVQLYRALGGGWQQ